VGGRGEVAKEGNRMTRKSISKMPKENHYIEDFLSSWALNTERWEVTL